MFLNHVYGRHEIDILSYKLSEKGENLSTVIQELEKGAILALFEAPIDQTKVHSALVHLRIVDSMLKVRLKNFYFPQSVKLLQDHLTSLEGLTHTNSSFQVLWVHLGQRVLDVHVPVLQMLFRLRLFLNVT